MAEPKKRNPKNTPGKPRVTGGTNHNKSRSRRTAGGPGKPPALRKKRSGWKG
ncbi:MAG: hypothetical protein MSC31_17155 [Solirubrobacteraceae bacterium MAG38_C4-C5]|nr:hypothetical protein [Candidatus Siliceabacter maunaloa]